jgi:hypothetical protein
MFRFILVSWENFVYLEVIMKIQLTTLQKFSTPAQI